MISNKYLLKQNKKNMIDIPYQLPMEVKSIIQISVVSITDIVT